MKSLLASLSIFLISLAAYSQTELVKGQILNRHINYGEAQLYKIKIRKGDFYKSLVMQNGIDLTIDLTTPDNNTITTFDSPNGTTGPENIEFLSNANGWAWLNVKPLADSLNTKSGEYTIELLEDVSAADYAAFLKQQEADENEFIEWIRKNSIQLQSVKAGSGFGDLDSLKAVLANKRVVGLGEATHGTKEFFEMKHRMLEFLVKELGFTVFAIEASYGRCKYINDYVLNGRGNLDTATVIQGFTTWSTEEVKDMIQWMRSYNASNPAKKIQFVGFDLQVNDAVSFAISNYYKKVDPGKKESVDSLLKKIDEGELRGGVFSGDTTLKELIGPTKNLIGEFIHNKEDYVQKTSSADYEEILWSQRILYQYLISYSFDNFTATVKQKDRDYFMAQNILAWLSYFPPDTKMVVWAHNGHITKDSDDVVLAPMGSYLKRELKDDYYAIGFDFYKGSFRSNDIDTPNSPGWEVEQVGEAPKGSLSSYFVRAGLSNAFLDFTQTPKNLNIETWLNEKEVGTYSMGSQFSLKWPQSNYIAQMKIYHAFDGVIFIKESNAALPVKSLTITQYNF